MEKFPLPEMRRRLGRPLLLITTNNIPYEPTWGISFFIRRDLCLSLFSCVYIYISYISISRQDINRNKIVFTIYWLIRKQTDSFCLLPNQSENGIYNLISVWFNKVSKMFPCVYTNICLEGIQISRVILVYLSYKKILWKKVRFGDQEGHWISPNLETSIAHWIKKPARRTSEHNHESNYLNF